MSPDPGARSLKTIAAGRQLVLNFAVRVGGMGTGFLVDVVFARMLGRDNYGIFALALSMIAVFGLLSGGFPRALVRVIGGRTNINSDEISGHIKLTILWTASVSAAGAFLMVLGAGIYTNTQLNLSDLRQISIPAAVQLFLFALCSLWVGIFEGMQLSSIGYFIREIIVRFLKLAFLFLVAAWLGYTATSLMWAFCMAQVLALIFYILSSGRYGGAAYKLRNIIVARLPDKSSRKEFMSFTWALVGNAVLGMLILHTSRMILGYYRTSGEIGLFSVAINLKTLMLFGLGSVNVVLLPMAARLYAIGEMNRVKVVYQASFNVIVALTVPIFAVMALFPKEILSVYGPEFVEAAPILVLISAASFFSAITGANYPFLIMSKHYRFDVFVTFISGLTNIFLALFLIPNHGIYGAAFAFVVSRLLMTFCRSLRLYIAFRMSPFSMNSWKFIVLFPIVYLIKYAVVNDGINPILAILIVLILTFLSTILVYRYLVMSLNEMQIIINTFKSFKSIRTKNINR